MMTLTLGRKVNEQEPMQLIHPYDQGLNNKLPYGKLT